MQVSRATLEGDSDKCQIGNSKLTCHFAGVVMSLDDFYVTSAQLASTETTLFVYDKELFRHLSPSGVVYEPVRVMVANRLANNGKKWADVFKMFNRCGTIATFDDITTLLPLFTNFSMIKCIVRLLRLPHTNVLLICVSNYLASGRKRFQELPLEDLQIIRKAVMPKLPRKGLALRNN